MLPVSQRLVSMTLVFIVSMTLVFIVSCNHASDRTAPPAAQSGDTRSLPADSVISDDSQVAVSDSTDGVSNDTATSGCEPVAPSLRQLRLLTRREYHNTVLDLFPALAANSACASVEECAHQTESCIAGQCVVDPCGVHTFSLSLAPNAATSVHVAGSFNNWAESVASGGVPLSYLPGLERWVAKHALPSGDWQYKYVVDGEWILDPDNPNAVDNGLGGQNSSLTITCATERGIDDLPSVSVDITAPTASFPVESRPTGFHFDNHVDSGLVTSVHLDAYFEAAKALSAAALPGIAKSLSCTPGSDPTVCMSAFVKSFGRRAFRRELSATEITRYTTRALAASSFDAGIHIVIHTMLSSPYFLYRFELGEPTGDTTYSLTAYERATALSYLIWASMPDEELFNAAESGELETLAGLVKQATRLLAHPKARDALGHFTSQWLGIEGIQQANRNATLFPEFSPALAAVMQEETRQFVNHVVFDSTGTLAELFTADYAFVNDALAPIYDMEAIDGAQLRLQPSLSVRQAGLLAHASILTSTAHSDQTSPIRRGLFVRERLLCQSLGTPPPNAGGVPEVDPNATTKERFRQHTEDPFCASCHVYIDELGFGFERFDPIGAYRLIENGVAIEPDGDMNDIEGLGTNTSAPFQSLPELGAVLAQSQAVSQCFVKHAVHYAWGRFERSADLCTLEQLHSDFLAANGSIVELLLAIVRSDSFTIRTTKQPRSEVP